VTLLATVDVESLYTNIPHTGGLQALQHVLQQRDPTFAPSNDCILQLNELVLSNYDFFFETDLFLQIRGAHRLPPFSTTMLTCMWENLRKRSFTKQRHPPLLSKILIWKRYIEDVFMLWEGSQQELNEFQTLLNESSEYLQFTMQTDERKIHYLD
jgi:hypothetical protein